jgi:flagellar biosynthesis protein FlhA
MDVMDEIMTEETEEKFISTKVSVHKQADFLGSLANAARFIAGATKMIICIIAAGVLGGIIIGKTIHGQTIQGAMALYGSLSLGNGIIVLLPLLMLSVAIAVGVIASFPKFYEETPG